VYITLSSSPLIKLLKDHHQQIIQVKEKDLLKRNLITLSSQHGRAWSKAWGKGKMENSLLKIHYLYIITPYLLHLYYNVAPSILQTSRTCSVISYFRHMLCRVEKNFCFKTSKIFREKVLSLLMTWWKYEKGDKMRKRRKGKGVRYKGWVELREWIEMAERRHVQHYCHHHHHHHISSFNFPFNKP